MARLSIKILDKPAGFKLAHEAIVNDGVDFDRFNLWLRFGQDLRQAREPFTFGEFSSKFNVSDMKLPGQTP